MFEYEIFGNFDENIFQKQCKALEENIPMLAKDSYLEDVDGSQLQIYVFPNQKKVKVFNDRLIGVEVHSEVKLESYFNN